jgi:hypothetical protein
MWQVKKLFEFTKQKIELFRRPLDQFLMEDRKEVYDIWKAQKSLLKALDSRSKLE